LTQCETAEVNKTPLAQIASSGAFLFVVMLWDSLTYIKLKLKHPNEYQKLNLIPNPPTDSDGVRVDRIKRTHIGG